MRTSGRLRTLIVALALATAGGASAATPFCEGVKSVIAQAGDDFARLQGAPKEAHVVKALLVLPTADSCAIVEQEEFVEYVCIFGYRTAAEREGNAVKMSSDLSACLGVPTEGASDKTKLFALTVSRKALLFGTRRNSGPPDNLYGIRLSVMPLP